MRLRTRKYVLLVVVVVVGVVYARLTLGWSDLEVYAGGAGVLTLLLLVGLPWLEFAPDGAFRRQPHA
jgi:hypothetical protein